MPNARSASVLETRHSQELDTEDEGAWEEVAVPHEQPRLEITLQTRARSKSGSRTPSKKAAVAQRLIRIECHKLHTICLLANAHVRNQWINDDLLQARLMSLTPLSLQNSFTVIQKYRIPDQNKRGRMFESAMNRLTEWWSRLCFEVLPVGHLRSRTFEEVQALLDAGLEPKEECEVIRGPESLMKHALMRRGSRDVSAQLFTALCRALGIPARLVVSLQSVPWQANVSKPSGGGRGHGKESSGADIQTTGSNSETDDTDNTGGSAEHGVRLRRSKRKGQKLGSTITRSDPLPLPPVFWTEVFSRPDTRWIPVDPVRCIVNKRKTFDPSLTSSTSPENKMVYVLAFEEDGFVREVTPRYAKQYGAKVAKVQLGGGAGKRGGKAKDIWWQGVLGAVARPYRLHRDEVEDEELDAIQLSEAMPTTIAGFKDHPLYILERHIHANEVIHPLTLVGSFRGEPVYPRSSLVSLKTAENWMRTGRVVKEGLQPMKMGKVRASTIGRLRALEVAGHAAGREGEDPESAMQGLYAEHQTELYIPRPVVDGKVPKNDYGNLDLYVPSMLPRGAAHIPFKGVAKVARQLGFDYAEAVTGFEFKKRRAFPVIEGIVVAAENQATLLEAYWEAEQHASQKARAKLQERVIKRWVKLVQGLRIRQRLLEQYKAKGYAVEELTTTPVEAKAQDIEPTEPGGFLIDADRVVQAFTLPKEKHYTPAIAQTRLVAPTISYSLPEPLADTTSFGEDHEAERILDLVDLEEDMIADDNVDGTAEAFLQGRMAPETIGTPISMRALAEASTFMESDSPATAALTPDLSSCQIGPPKNANNGKIGNEKKRAQMANRTSTSGNSSDHDDSKHHPSPSKRIRLELKMSLDDPGTPTSNRTLRPRVPKSPAKIEQEKLAEEAYRRAVARQFV